MPSAAITRLSLPALLHLGMLGAGMLGAGMLGAGILGACGESAPDSVELRVSVSVPTDEFHVFIDGEPTIRLRRDLSHEEYQAYSYELEVRHAETGLVVASRTVESSCDRYLESGYVYAEGKSYCLFDTGQLVFSSLSCRTSEESGVSDTFCPRCGYGNENAGLVCDLIQVHEDPLLWHLEEGPPGQLPEGAACTWGPAGPENHNPCELGTVCHEDRCQRVCDIAEPAACEDIPDAACREHPVLARLSAQLGTRRGFCR